MRVALGQPESGADIRANLAAMDRFTGEAARDGAALVAFPEYARESFPMFRQRRA